MTPVKAPGVRFPYGRVLLPRTRLAYVNLHNLLNDAKRDRSARVSGYVAVWLPDEFIVLYLHKGEVVNAVRNDGDAYRVEAIGSAVNRIPSGPEFGEICFHEAEPEQLGCMFMAQTIVADGWPRELAVQDPKVLFPYLMATTFDGVVSIEGEGAANFLLFRDGSVDSAYVAAAQGGTLVQRVSSLFARDRRGISVRRWNRRAELPEQAPPALVSAYRELMASLVARVIAAGGQSAQTVAEAARQSLLPRHSALAAFAFGPVKSMPEPVADAGELTAAVASWIQEFMWAAATLDTSSPEQILRDVAWERRHLFQSAGLFDRIPWKVA
jgi:hypothetical protein